MKTEEIEKKLQQIENKNIQFEGKPTKITKFKISSTNVVLFFEDRPRNFLLSEMEELFAFDLIEITEIQSKESYIPVVTIPENKVIFNPTSQNATIKETLMETLTKVKSDPNYIPQANAICSIVSQMVNIQKEEIKMIQVLRK